MKQLILPGNRAFNSNGLPEAGATASLYETGTTTPAAFLDENGDSLGSTITSNGAGRFTPMPFQDDATPYRLIIRDADGNELDDIDPFYFGNAVWGVVTSAAGGSYSSRSLLAGVTGTSKQSAILTESGREGSFVFDASDLSTEVAADTAQGVYVAPATDTTGASGAWVRQLGPSTIVSAAWFGHSPSATAATNYAALEAAMSLADDLGFYKRVSIGIGEFTHSASHAIPNNVTIEGSGRETVLIASNVAGDDPWLFNQTNGTGFVISNLKITPSDTSSGTDNHRAGIHLTTCQNFKIIDVWVEGHTNAHGVFLHDCDYYTIDRFFFDGGASKNGTGVYSISPIGSQVSNSTAINCFAGFGISGAGTDPTWTTRTIAQTYGNTISNCVTRYCTTQAYDVNSSTHNTVANCHAFDYAGVSTHKAFQVKDAVGFENSSIGNKVIGCTAVNYPAGFGGVRTSRAQFIGCSAKNLTTNFLELSTCNYFQFVGCEVSGFANAGIYFGGANTCHNFTDISLQTSTATATGILTDTGATANSCNFNSVTTLSTLAAYVNFTAGSTNNRFDIGCRSNLQPIVDASNATIWPLRVSSGILTLTGGTAVPGTNSYIARGMHVAISRFIVTVNITGTPAINAGYIGSTAAIVAAQAVTGNAGAVVTLTQAASSIGTNKAITAAASTVGTAGAGYVQFEGLPAA